MNDLVVRYLQDNEKPDRWELVEPLGFATVCGPVLVPAGYVTDFASAPVILWGVFPPIGRYNRDCVLHDFWYDSRLFEAEYGAKVARKLADQEFLRRLNLVEPKRKIRNYCMYLAVRWFGRSWWEN